GVAAVDAGVGYRGGHALTVRVGQDDRNGISSRPPRAGSGGLTPVGKRADHSWGRGMFAGWSHTRTMGTAGTGAVATTRIRPRPVSQEDTVRAAHTGWSGAGRPGSDGQ